MKRFTYTRRRSLALFAGQQIMGEPAGRTAPVNELVNVPEFEDVARRKLGDAVYRSIAGGDRKAFDRITFRPRLMVDATHLDLSTELFGDKMFAPILVGPCSDQKRFHPEGELAMVRGAAAGKATMVVSSGSSYDLEKIAAEAKTTVWYQVLPGPDVEAIRGRIKRAVEAGCKAVCITLGTPQAPALNWGVIDRLRQSAGVPVLLKGIMSPTEAHTAVERGVQGVVISNYGGLLMPGLAPTIEVLPSIANAVGKKIPILIDGSFRRGSDILKALALGAQGVLLGRPALWGLAAYGAPGVQAVLELLQTELARAMALCGRPNLKALDPSVVKIHEW